MYSFGPIKTASAMGGAVVRVASPELCRRMAESLSCDPLQSRVKFAKRLVRFAVLKALSGHHISALFCRCVSALGFDVDTLVNSFGRGFASTDILPQIRRQPSAPLLRLLRRRWLHYDFSRIERRTRLGRYLDQQTGNSHPPEHSFWVYPVFAPDPEAVRDRLKAAGFDATTQSRMIVVPPVDDVRVALATERRWRQVVFLPWYPDLTDEAVEAMAMCLTAANEPTRDSRPQSSNV
jgi:dTDP-4-amino-4,6-dideoxygalactose transaminase